MKNPSTSTITTEAAGRVACPSCGHQDTLGDLARQVSQLRRRAGLPADPITGPTAPTIAPAGLHADVCAACGTIYYPWVLREASRRRAELARLRDLEKRGELAPTG